MANPYSVEARKIDPYSKNSSTTKMRADGTPDINDRVEIGPTALAFCEWRDAGQDAPNIPLLRAYRLQRIKDQLKMRDYAGILLFDPLNIRYATDATNMMLWTAHNAARACFIATDGPVILWDFFGCGHLTKHLPLIDEVRHGASFFYFETGDRTPEKAREFTETINDLVTQYGGGNRRLAVDKIEHVGAFLLQQHKINLMDGQEVTEIARSVKDDNELKALKCAILSCERAMDEMRLALKPGISENELWSHLHAGNIKRGGEWIETRLIASGPRTNPWFQECGPRIIENGDLMAFDTDMVGPYGYCCDISRTWLCGDRPPTAAQKEMYQVAHDHIHHNMSILKPGLALDEVTNLSKELPEKYRAQRYGVMMHGVGLCDEYPCIRYREDLTSASYGGVLEVGMVLSVEAYVGAVGEREGVKLEEQVVITENGYEKLSHYPYEEILLG